MPGRVESIHVAAAEGAPMEPVSVAECRADHGLVGDRYARKGAKGQITIVSAEQLALAAGELGGAIAPGATRRNVTVSGVPLPGPGGRLTLGPVVVEVTGPADPCGLMDRVIGPGARRALEGRGGVRARIVEGGRMAVGDAVEGRGPDPGLFDSTPNG